MFRVWAAKEKVSVELTFGFAKIKTRCTGTKLLQVFLCHVTTCYSNEPTWCFPILQNFPDICMDVAFPATPVQTRPHLCIFFLWIRLLRHNLSRNNHTTVSQLMGLGIYTWRLITSAFEPHWRICCKVCLKTQSILWGIFYFLDFFLLRFIQQGFRNKQEHVISKKPNAVVLTNSQSTVLPTLQCFPEFLTAVWNEEYVYLNSPLWNQLSSTPVCVP